MIGARREPHTVTSGKYRLAVCVDRPEGVHERTPAVLFCHGFTGNRVEARRLFVRMANALAVSGIASVRFDHRGCGESDGEFQDFTTDGMLEDLAVMDGFTSRLEHVDPGRLAVLGFSLGGVSASYVASHGTPMRCAAMWAPVAHPRIVHARLSRTAPSYDGYPERGYVDDRGFRISAAYLDLCATRFRPLEWIARFPNPTLFCHGTEDPVVPPEHTDDYLAARRNAADEKVLIEGADHAFGTAEMIDRLLETTANWFVRHLQGE